MIAQLRSELLKQRSTRTSSLLAMSLIGLVLLLVALHVLSFSATDLGQRDTQQRIVGLGTTLAALFAALAGALSVTAEFRAGTIRPTLLITPSRERVLAAKLAVSATAGIAVGLLAEALTAAGVAAGIAARGIEIELTSGDIAQLVAGGAVASGLLALIGAGLGAALRNQVTVVAGLCLWLLFVEPLVLANLPDAGRFAPEASAGAVAGAIQTQVADHLVAPAAGLALLAGYAAAAALLGVLLFTRRDID